MNIEYSKEKAFWQKYTDEELTDRDIDEINLNLRDFAQAVLDIHKDLEKENKGEVIDE